QHRLDLAVVVDNLRQPLTEEGLEHSRVAREVRSGEVLLLVAQEPDSRDGKRVAGPTGQAPPVGIAATAGIDELDHGRALVTANPPRCPHEGHTAAAGMLSPPATMMWMSPGAHVTGIMVSGSRWSTHAGHQSYADSASTAGLPSGLMRMSPRRRRACSHRK